MVDERSSSLCPFGTSTFEMLFSVKKKVGDGFGCCYVWLQCPHDRSGQERDDAQRNKLLCGKIQSNSRGILCRIKGAVQNEQLTLYEEKR